ncbi:MAG: hypothetical protein H5U16_13060 [Roseovarius sp.]|nr:hypothetical protein [Roseovarius sp.]
MTSRLEELRDRIAELRQEIDDEIARRRARFHYRLERGRAVFEKEVQARHRAARVPLLRFLARTRPLVLLTAPVIYALIVPFLLLDLCVSLYQAICFPVYGIGKVRRGDYIVMDRHRLAYLNGLQKLNCIYCGYCNGIIAYTREIAARTEQYWCPIKHARRTRDHHDRYSGFMDFGDAEAFDTRLAELRALLADETSAKSTHRSE